MASHLHRGVDGAIDKAWLATIDLGCRAPYQRFDCFGDQPIKARSASSRFETVQSQGSFPRAISPIAFDAANQTLAVMIDFDERSAAAVAEFRHDK